MDIAAHQKDLQEIFDRAAREVTEQIAGISLEEGDAEPSGNLCTLYAEFERGFHTGVSLCAEEALLARLTRRMMRVDNVTPQDVEDFSKEYFNVLCGHIASYVYRLTKVASRFGIPSFYRGRYEPNGQQPHFVISYTSDGHENAQLIHHTPYGQDIL